MTSDRAANKIRTSNMRGGPPVGTPAHLAETDSVDKILQDFRTAIDREAAIAMDRLRAIALTFDSARLPANHDLRLISVGAAGHFADLSDDRIRALCRQHPYGSTPGGFGYRVGGRWQVVEAIFVQHILTARV